MEGRAGTLFNHAHPNGIRVTVQEVDPENQSITFYMDPDGDELNLNLSNEQPVRNDDELQANRDKYFVEWEHNMENEPESPISTIPSGSQNNGPHGGKRKRRTTRVRKTRRLRKVKKTRKSRK